MYAMGKEVMNKLIGASLKCTSGTLEMKMVYK